MVLRRGRDDQVRLRKGMTSLAALLEEKPPLEHDVLGNWQDPLLKHWPDFKRQPIVEIEAARSVWEQFDAEPKLSKRYDTDKQKIERLPLYEGDDLALRFGAP